MYKFLTPLEFLSRYHPFTSASSVAPVSGLSAFCECPGNPTPPQTTPNTFSLVGSYIKAALFSLTAGTLGRLPDLLRWREYLPQSLLDLTLFNCLYAPSVQREGVHNVRNWNCKPKCDFSVSLIKLTQVLREWGHRNLGEQPATRNLESQQPHTDYIDAITATFSFC